MKKKKKHLKKHTRIKKEIVQVLTVFILLILSSAVELNAQNLLSENLDSCEVIINSLNEREDRTTSVLGFDMQSLRSEGDIRTTIKENIIQTKKTENAVAEGRDEDVVAFYSQAQDGHSNPRFLSCIMNRENVGYYLK